MMASFHCCGTSPPLPKTNDDIEQSPSHGGITVEGDHQQLNGPTDMVANPACGQLNVRA